MTYRFKNTSFICFLKMVGKRIMKNLNENFFRLADENLMCRIRLCIPDVIIHDGLTSWNEKKNKPPQYALMTVKSCSKCGRRTNAFWSKERKKEYENL